jgi:cephalosporin-C deacetylase-like acetyl esterase
MIERALTVHAPYEDIAALLWLPDEQHERLPLVIAGHGFTQHKRALFPPLLVHNLTTRGFAVAAIDAPEHGDRSVDIDDRAAIDAAWRVHWREFAASRLADEHRALVDTVSAQPEVDAGRLGYFGLSLGTQYGVGVLAEDTRYRAAVLGLSALPDPGPRIGAYAARLRCAVFFIQQLDDEIARRDRARALYDAIASRDKTFRASSGAHMAVPAAVFSEAYDFLARRLGSEPRSAGH